MAALSKEEILDKIDELPTLPSIVFELNQVINDPMSAAADVEKIMLNDQSLTSRVLKLVNSSYYAIPGGVSNLKRAIVYLGFDTIQQLVLTASVMDTVDTSGDGGGIDLGQFWLHSMGVGMAAETIAKFLQHSTPADLFTAGLLHDLGKVALHMISPDELGKVVAHAKETSSTLDEAEVELGVISHAELGKSLTEKWQLPRKIQVTTLHHHHADLDERDNISPELSEMIDMVVLANLLIHALKFGHSGHDKILGAPKPLLARLNIEPAKVKDVLGEIKKALENAEAFLRIVGGG